MRPTCHRLLSVLFIIPLALGAFAETDTVLILHTNDVHDHVRVGYGGLGGLPYVSGYIKQVRSERPDTLVVDAGDLMHKGDMVAFRTDSAIVFEAMAKIGYDFAAPGNHDLDQGFPFLKEYLAATGHPMRCLNTVDENGSSPLMPSQIFDVDGVKVGVIGITTPTARTLDMAATTEAVAKEAERLDVVAHLVVVVAHIGSGKCAEIALKAPAVDVFVGGHQHEAMQDAKMVEETGARVIVAGDYAKYVGRLELTIDLDSEEVVDAKRVLVPMNHDEVPCDVALRDWVMAREQQVCPEAARVIGRADRTVSGVELARLYADAMRRKAKADIGFCGVRRFLGPICAGPVDVNALFSTFRYDGSEVVVATMTGREILDYLASAPSERERTLWAGFRAEVVGDAPPNVRVTGSNIDPARSYKVAMSEAQWSGKVLPALTKGRDPATPPEAPSKCGFTTVDALAEYLTAVTAEGESVDAMAEALAEAAAPLKEAA
jgi:5'-nucleotidase / UDP-sugar diphosphatase